MKTLGETVGKLRFPSLPSIKDAPVSGEIEAERPVKTWVEESCLIGSKGRWDRWMNRVSSPH